MTAKASSLSPTTARCTRPGSCPSALGSVRERPVLEIYRDDPVLKAIRKAEFPGRCGYCEYADECGGSRARAYAATGDPLADDPACSYVPSGRHSGSRRFEPAVPDAKESRRWT